jgi:hypothetical protein
MIGRSTAAGFLVVALAAAAPSGSCAYAVRHPAITAGVVGGALGMGSCKLASDNLGACAAVGGATAAFLGLVAAAAIWLGGEGSTAPIEETAQPLPEDDRPRRRPRRPAAADVDAPVPADAASPPASPVPASPAPASPAPASPAPASPAPASPAPPPAVNPATVIEPTPGAAPASVPAAPLAPAPTPPPRP